MSVPKTLYNKNFAKQKSEEPVTRENQWQQPRDKRDPEPQFVRTAGVRVPRSELHPLALGTLFPILNTWTP